MSNPPRNNPLLPDEDTEAARAIEEGLLAEWGWRDYDTEYSDGLPESYDRGGPFDGGF